MLPFKNRLVKRKDFENVQRSGHFFTESNLAIKIAGNNLKETRIGFVVGLKFSKKAVERNLAKRQLREIFQKKLPDIKKGFDMVVMVRKREGEKIMREKLAESAKKILEKSDMLIKSL